MRFLTFAALALLCACDPANPPEGDGGPPRDAGARVDGGARADAGPIEDAGGAEDAGPGADAGPGEPDAGPACVGGSTSVYLIGDSTVASGSGWGDFLADYLRADAVVDNAARSGRSSKSFYDEGAFDAVRDALEPGDFVLIQFGHNDSKPEEYRRTEPGEAPDFEGTFREYLERYLGEIRAAGATPVLLTPVSRMTFGSSGALNRTHGLYPAAARQVAADHGVVLLDLEEASYQRFDSLGEEQTVALFAEEPDRTHFPPDKAFRVTEMVIALLAASDSPLRCWIEE